MIDFLKPINNEILDFTKGLSSQHLGSKIEMHVNKNFPFLEKIKIAIIGVRENIDENISKKSEALDSIRKEFYQLYFGNWIDCIADLGDIIESKEIQDTYFLVQNVCENLLKKNIIPIIIGGTQDLTYPMYRAYDHLEQMVNLIVIDNKFDFGNDRENITSSSYLTRIIVDQPNNLFNFSNVGYQTYLNSQEEIDLIENLYFDAYRLGEISNNITITEPAFRDADLVSIDLQSVESAFSGNFTNFMPNGFNGKEICALSRYAGISDKVSTFGIFNHNNSQKEAVLIAQILWYFIEGYNYRSREYPFSSKENYIKYIVLIDNQEIVFYKSNKSDRWWIEIKYIIGNKLKNNMLLPCTHEDYLAACNQEIPERWWKAQRKNCV